MLKSGQGFNYIVSNVVTSQKAIDIGRHMCYNKAAYVNAAGKRPAVLTQE